MSQTSRGILNSHGFVDKIENHIIKFIRGAMILMNGVIKNGLYVLDGHTVIGTTAIVDYKRMSSAQL